MCRRAQNLLGTASPPDPVAARERAATRGALERERAATRTDVRDCPHDRGRRPWAAIKRLDLLGGAARCSVTELAAMAGFFAIVAFAVFGVHVTRGGLSFDDWTLAYDVDRLVDSRGFLGAFNELMSGDILTGNMAGRPVEAGYNLLIYSAFGQHAELHLAAAVVLAALVAFLFYVLLRLLRLERLHAAAIASLALLFPAADSTVFWATGAIAHVTIALYLAGAICRILGLRSRGAEAVGLHLLGVSLYTASILQYQIAAPFVLLSVFVYRFAGASWRRAVKPWLAAVTVGLIALAYVKANLPRQRGSLSDDFRHARDIAGAARQLARDHRNPGWAAAHAHDRDPCAAGGGGCPRLPAARRGRGARTSSAAGCSSQAPALRRSALRTRSSFLATSTIRPLTTGSEIA